MREVCRLRNPGNLGFSEAIVVAAHGECAPAQALPRMRRGAGATDRRECLGRLIVQEPHKAHLCLRRIDRRLRAWDQQSNLAIRPVDFGFTRLVSRGGP